MWSFLKLSLLTQAVAFPHLLLHAEDDNQHKAAGDAEKLPLRRALQQQTDLIDNIKEDIEALVIGTPTLAAKFVRLVFHDCVGGCNGCIDFQNPDNRGLLAPIEALQPTVDAYEGQISRADIWALAGLYSAELSTTLGGNGGGNTPLTFPFDLTGRIDCDAVQSAMCTNFLGVTAPCSATNNHHFDFPSADLTTAGLLSYFASEFDFDAQETVAILGAHSIGVAAREDSGFPGQNGWDNDQLRLNNNYYSQIVGDVDDPGNAPGWTLFQVDNSDIDQVPDRNIWFRGRGGGGGNVVVNGNLPNNRPFMLSADVSLVRDFSDSIGADGGITCSFNVNNNNACPYASTTIQAAEYQEDNGLWLEDFRDALTKMSQNGYTADIGLLIPENNGFVPACFSGENTVTLEGGKSVPIQSLAIGDKVLVHGGSYESVYSFGHRNLSESAEYLRLATKSAILELTSDHMLLINDSFVPASIVQVGDYLSNGESVSSIKTVTRKGIYAPFTTTGTIVVSGIVSSSFVSLQKDATHLTLGSSITFPMISWQWMCYTFEAPHRFLANLGFGETYSEDGISMWAVAPKLAMEWILNQNVVIMSMLLVPAVAGLAIVSLVEQPFFILAMSLVITFVSRRRDAKTA